MESSAEGAQYQSVYLLQIPRHRPRRLRREHDDPRLLEPSALAGKEIERLTQLLNDFLAFARPPELHLEDRDVAEKAELATKARLMYEDALRQVQADIRAQSATLASGRERIANLSQSLLPAADQRVQLANAAYRAGSGSLADTFAARRAQLEAQLQVLDLKREVSQTWAQLEYQVVPPTMAAAQ